MNKKFEQELIKLAKKYNMEYYSSCSHCEETVTESSGGDIYCVSFLDKNEPEENKD